MKQTVALLFGGKGEERAVSFRSAAAVFRHLDRERYAVIPIGIDRSGDFFIYNGDMSRIGQADFRKDTEHLQRTFPARLLSHSGFLCEDRLVAVDAVLPILHGRGGEDGEIQGLLSAAGIPFVGCDAISSAVCFDKAYTKAVAEKVRVPMAAGLVFSEKTEPEAAYRAVYSAFPADQPLFVKPARQGSSFGASVVHAAEDFKKCYDLARVYGRVLVEEYIGSKVELEVAMLEREGELLFAGPGAITSAAPLYSYEEKYESRTCAAAVVTLECAIREQVLSYARALADALSLRGLARIDFFLTPEGQIYFNEVNTLPGFTETSLYPRLWEAQGIPFTALLDILIGEAIARFS